MPVKVPEGDITETMTPPLPEVVTDGPEAVVVAV